MILNFGCETQERYTLEGIYAGWQRKMDVAALEVQGAKDPEFAKRMFKYYYRILDRFDKPVSALAIFPGGMEKRCRTDLRIIALRPANSISTTLCALQTILTKF